MPGRPLVVIVPVFVVVDCPRQASRPKLEVDTAFFDDGNDTMRRGKVEDRIDFMATQQAMDIGQAFCTGVLTKRLSSFGFCCVHQKMRTIPSFGKRGTRADTL